MSIFALNEPSSTKIASALSQGIPLSKIFKTNYSLSTYNFFTSLNTELYELWETRDASSLFFHVDKSYFARDRFYRINLNSMQGNLEFPPNYERLRFAGVRARKRRKGTKILLCPQSSRYFELIGLTKESWISQVTAELRKYTDRPIIVHEKAKGSLKIGYSEKMFFKALGQNIYATVVHSSMAGIQSSLFGVPCLVTDKHSVVRHFGDTDFSIIEDIALGDNREFLAAKLANNQWTLHEIQHGVAWQAIRKHLLGFFDSIQNEF